MTIPTEELVFRTKPWSHQRQAFDFALPRRASLLGMDMGTGKSKVAIDLAANWLCKRALVLCPTSVRAVWRREIACHAPEDWQAVILEEKSVSRKLVVAERAIVSTRPIVVVVNYESAWRNPLGSWLRNQGWNLIVLDESHRIKAHNSKVSKFCAELTDKGQRLLALTGTPMPHSQMDVFGQFRFLDSNVFRSLDSDPNEFGCSWWAFRHKYGLRENPLIPQQVTSYINQEDLQSRVAPYMYQCRAEDVLDLPEIIHHRRTAKLSSKGMKHYREIEKHLITEVAEGRITTVANALVKFLRLQQATSGYVVEDHTGVETEVDDTKRQLLKDLLRDLGEHEPVVVFCRFRHDLRAVERTVEELNRTEGTRRRFGEISGQRKNLTEHATMPENVDVMAVQIQSGGLGIDLTRARYGVFYSLGFVSPGDYEQAMARLHRPGQIRTTHFYHLIVEGTVDEKIARALDQRTSAIDAVLDAIRSKANGETRQYGCGTEGGN